MASTLAAVGRPGPRFAEADRLELLDDFAAATNTFAAWSARPRRLDEFDKDNSGNRVGCKRTVPYLNIH